MLHFDFGRNPLGIKKVFESHEEYEAAYSVGSRKTWEGWKADGQPMCLVVVRKFDSVYICQSPTHGGGTYIIDKITENDDGPYLCFTSSNVDDPVVYRDWVFQFDYENNTYNVYKMVLVE